MVLTSGFIGAGVTIPWNRNGIEVIGNTLHEHILFPQHGYVLYRSNIFQSIPSPDQGEFKLTTTTSSIPRIL